MQWVWSGYRYCRWKNFGGGGGGGGGRRGKGTGGKGIFFAFLFFFWGGEGNFFQYIVFPLRATQKLKAQCSKEIFKSFFTFGKPNRGGVVFFLFCESPVKKRTGGFSPRH